MIIYENTSEIAQFEQTMNRTQEAVNLAVQEFNKLPLKKITTKEQVIALFNDFDKFVLDMLPMAENQTLFGITVNKTKAMNLLELDLQPFKTMFESHQFFIISVEEFLSIAVQKNGQFTIDSKLLAKRLDTFRRYAKTQKEVEIATAMEAVVKNVKVLQKHGLNLNRFVEYFKINSSGLEWNINRISELLN